jgi:hypothetical protein
VKGERLPKKINESRYNRKYERKFRRVLGEKQSKRDLDVGTRRYWMEEGAECAMTRETQSGTYGMDVAK